MPFLRQPGLKALGQLVSSSYRVQHRCFSSAVNQELSAHTKSPREQRGYNETPRLSLLLEVDDKPGALHDTLRYFWKHDVNMTRIESRPSKRNETSFDIQLDCDGAKGDLRIDRLLQDLRGKVRSMLVLDEKEVPWFPRVVADLDLVASRVLDAGTDLKADHPGFTDAKYRARRAELAQMALDYFHASGSIPRIHYTSEEVGTWSAVLAKQEELLHRYACREYLDILSVMKERCGYSKRNIPQQQDISEFLLSRTGFRLYPVSGLLSSRDFLNGLAFRVFFSTQYIRHHSVPLYTPEPDICHELLGHAPMFADPDFADFSMELGLASLGASDEEVQKLARCYWHSVEFGLCRQDGQLKAYGAGLISSFGELEYACADYRPAGGTDARPQYLPWDPTVAAHKDFPITRYQPAYFVADSLADAKERMRQYCEEHVKRPFYARYNPLTDSIWVDRAVRIAENSKPGKRRLTRGEEGRGGGGVEQEG